ncbi:ArpU family phage packaging/lysis transcriptional regulator [Bacillus massiliglaciei]|uniref:ArpU family phage packaging/lysis transcriptional regulator n=1 Tax=Bacillus massiliglaciei TaxID=1816693 RepID=UPI000DA636A6|nr:ArpU family phage packaging/lysis transcriptional regulator [Bacillus massiliglaciei]
MEQELYSINCGQEIQPKVINDRELKRIVAEELKFYKALKVLVKNNKELKETGVGRVFPEMISRDSVKELKYKHVNRVLNEVLDDTQRMILEKKYLGNIAVNDLTICMDLGLSKNQFYDQKKQAIRLFATALGII